MPGFQEILGQSHIRAHLSGAIRKKKVSHAYLLSGEEMSGKRFIADVFTQTLLCTDKKTDGAPCECCAACKRVKTGSHPDVRVVTHEKAGSIRVSEIITQVVDDAYLTPYEAEKKIYIIPDAHLMTTEAQNKLLKTLEEPPSYVVFLLLSTHKEALLQTIRSRCVPLALGPVTTDELSLFLQQTQHVTAYGAKQAARLSRGNTGRAIALSSDKGFEQRVQDMLQMMELLGESALFEINERTTLLAQGAGDEKKFRDELFEILRLLIRDIFLYKATESRRYLILDEKWEYIRDVALHTTFHDLTLAHRALKEASLRIEANVNAQLSTDMLLLRLRDTLQRT